MFSVTAYPSARSILGIAMPPGRTERRGRRLRDCIRGGQGSLRSPAQAQAQLMPDALGGALGRVRNTSVPGSPALSRRELVIKGGFAGSLAGRKDSNFQGRVSGLNSSPP